MTIFTTTFWADASERALKTVAQSILSLWIVGDQVFNLMQVNWETTVGVALGAGVVSILMSITSATLTNGQASLSVKTVPKE